MAAAAATALALLTLTGAPAQAASSVGGCGRLDSGTAITSSDGHYATVMQSDGNLVTYVYGRPIWALGTDGHNGAWLSMQCDGNLVLVAPNGAPLWASGTNCSPGNYLAMQNDGNLVVISPNGSAAWASGGVNTRLQQGETLQPGWFIQSPDRRYRLEMQTDGNLVAYDGGTAIFATGTTDVGSDLEMQADGNLVIYRPGHVPVWASNTSGHPGAAMQGQNDGNFVIYAGGVALWASKGAAPSGTARQLASQVLANGNIALSGSCVLRDLQETAAGRVGSAGMPVSSTLLSDVLKIASTRKVVITAIESCGVGHTVGSNHYAGRAVDLVPGVTGGTLSSLAQLVYTNRAGYSVNELIFNPMPTGTKTLLHGVPFTYDTKTMNAHKDHVHLSTTS